VVTVRGSGLLAETGREEWHWSHACSLQTSKRKNVFATNGIPQRILECNALLKNAHRTHQPLQASVGKCKKGWKKDTHISTPLCMGCIHSLGSQCLRPSPCAVPTPRKGTRLPCSTKNLSVVCGQWCGGIIIWWTVSERAMLLHLDHNVVCFEPVFF
jgi:hypothetical protein